MWGHGESKRTIKGPSLALGKINAYSALRMKPLLNGLGAVSGEFTQCVALFA